MKKIIAAMTAFTAALSLMTGCGSTDSSSKGASSKSDSYEEALRDMYEASNNKDVEAMIKHMYPSELYDYLVDAGFADTFNEQTTGENKEKEITEIIEEEELGEDKFKDIEEAINGLYEMMIIAKEYDLSPDKTMYDLSEEDQKKISERIQKVQEGDVSETKYDVTKAFDITVKYTQDGEDGEDSLYAYYVEDEGWLFEQSMRKYVEKSRQTSLNASASSISKAVNSALMDLDSDGDDISGTYIISSVPAKNYNVPEDLDLDKLNKQIRNYFDKMDDLYFFCIISGGTAVYVSCEDQDNEYTGIYPIQSIPEDDDSTSYFDTRPMTSDEEKLGMEELYEIAVEAIK